MTAKGLMRAFKSGKCVTWISGRPMPAAFLASMQFHRVMEALPKIKPYKSKPKKRL